MSGILFFIFAIYHPLIQRLCSPVSKAYSYGIRHISLWFNEVWPYASLNYNGICRIPYENASRTWPRNLRIIILLRYTTTLNQPENAQYGTYDLFTLTGYVNGNQTTLQILNTQSQSSIRIRRMYWLSCRHRHHPISHKYILKSCRVFTMLTFFW